jgi:hypothetical protein
VLRWSCPNCTQEVFFNSFLCLACSEALLYSPARTRFSLLHSESACINREQYGICNWEAENPGGFCRACSANRVIPDLNIAGNLQKWHRLESAKRRLYYSCHRLGIATDGLAFRFIASTPQGRAVIGHCDGLITIDIEEADSAIRERNRQELQEEFRTLIGHFRHEFGHFFWSQRVAPYPQTLQGFRHLFGDERANYEASLQAYRARSHHGGPEFITEYASSHPWEDWAEIFAHYLHLRDVLETAREFGLSALAFFEFESGVEEWVRMSVAFNEINRSMGLPDLYPFALTPQVVTKLRFVHDLVSSGV